MATGKSAITPTAMTRAVLGHGVDETRWESPELPGMDVLDGLSPSPVLAVRADGHVSLANRQAITAAAVGEMPGVEIGPDGRPSGVLRREANWAIQRWFHEQLDDQEVQQLQLQAAGLAASRGITCVHEMAIPTSRG